MWKNLHHIAAFETKSLPMLFFVDSKATKPQ